LGVLALGRRALDAIRDSVPPQTWGRIKDLRPTIEAALLLHDVGHAPLSHICERFYDREAIVRHVADEHDIALPPKGPSHEAMSALVAVDCFGSQLETMGVDPELLSRMITRHTYPGSAQWPENVAIELLNSPCDVDKLDYVVRDNLMTGGQLAAFDYERIASSYTVLDRALVLSEGAMSAIANMVHGRNHMHVWVYNHHTTVYTNHLLSAFLSHLGEIGEVSLEELFSPASVSQRLVDDSDVLVLLKRNRDTDERCTRLFGQLYCRRHHRSVWKTWYEFEALLPDATAQDRVTGESGEEGHCDSLAADLREALGVGQDDLYVATAQFKPFTPVGAKNIRLATKRKTTTHFTHSFYSTTTKGMGRELPYIFYCPDRLDQKKVLAAVKSL